MPEVDFFLEPELMWLSGTFHVIKSTVSWGDGPGIEAPDEVWASLSMTLRYVRLAIIWFSCLGR